MDDVLIANINKKVKKNDRLFVLGDFCWGGKQKEYLDRINCKQVILVYGNHDKDYLCCPTCKQKYFADFAESHASYELKTNFKGKSLLVHMYHYPIKEWNQWHRGSWHLFGHTHQQIPDDPYNYSLDIGVDGHNFEPLSLDEIAAIMNKKQWHDPFKKYESEGRLWKKDGKTEEEIMGS